MLAQTFPPAFHPQRQETNRQVVAAAAEFGCKVYLVGGYIRDALLQRFDESHPPKDFDYTVLNGSAVAFARHLQARCGGHFVLLDADSDTARVVQEDGVQIDLAGCVGGKLETDVLRRDLTINAMAWDPGDPNRIIDQVGAWDDLNSRKVRAISEASFADDPLRLMRAFRFAAALDFTLDGPTREFVLKYAPLLSTVAVERISYELFAILDTPRAGASIRAMGDAGLLEQIFPELQATHRVPPNSYHHLPLYDHSLEAMQQSENSLCDLPPWALEHVMQPLSQRTTRFAATKLASLLHDVGKPDTWSVTPEGKHTFIGHDKLGAEMCDIIARRLKWPRPVERFVSNLVRWHLRPGALFHQGPPTERAVHRFFRTVSDDLPELILLALSDFRATCGPGLKEGREVLENQMRELLDSYVVFIEGKKKTSRLLDGADVMELLGIQPGPIVGEILDELEEAQGLREVQNKLQAETFVKTRFQQKYSS